MEERKIKSENANYKPKPDSCPQAFVMSSDNSSEKKITRRSQNGSETQGEPRRVRKRTRDRNMNTWTAADTSNQSEEVPSYHGDDMPKTAVDLLSMYIQDYESSHCRRYRGRRASNRGRKTSTQGYGSPKESQNTPKRKCSPVVKERVTLGECSSSQEMCEKTTAKSASSDRASVVPTLRRRIRTPKVFPPNDLDSSPSPNEQSKSPRECVQRKVQVYRSVLDLLRRLSVSAEYDRQPYVCLRNIDSVLRTSKSVLASTFPRNMTTCFHVQKCGKSVKPDTEIHNADPTAKKLTVCDETEKSVSSPRKLSPRRCSPRKLDIDFSAISKGATSSRRLSKPHAENIEKTLGEEDEVNQFDSCSVSEVHLVESAEQRISPEKFSELNTEHAKVNSCDMRMNKDREAATEESVQNGKALHKCTSETDSPNHSSHTSIIHDSKSPFTQTDEFAKSTSHISPARSTCQMLRIGGTLSPGYNDDKLRAKKKYRSPRAKVLSPKKNDSVQENASVKADISNSESEMRSAKSPCETRHSPRQSHSKHGKVHTTASPTVDELAICKTESVHSDSLSHSVSQRTPDTGLRSPGKEVKAMQCLFVSKQSNNEADELHVESVTKKPRNFVTKKQPNKIADLSFHDDPVAKHPGKGLKSRSPVKQASTEAYLLPNEIVAEQLSKGTDDNFVAKQPNSEKLGEDSIRSDATKQDLVERNEPQAAENYSAKNSSWRDSVSKGELQSTDSTRSDLALRGESWPMVSSSKGLDVTGKSKNSEDALVLKGASDDSEHSVEREVSSQGEESETSVPQNKSSIGEECMNFQSSSLSVSKIASLGTDPLVENESPDNNLTRSADCNQGVKSVTAEKASCDEPPKPESVSVEKTVVRNLFGNSRKVKAPPGGDSRVSKLSASSDHIEKRKLDDELSETQNVNSESGSDRPNKGPLTSLQEARWNFSLSLYKASFDNSLCKKKTVAPPVTTSVIRKPPPSTTSTAQEARSYTSSVKQKALSDLIAKVETRVNKKDSLQETPDFSDNSFDESDENEDDDEDEDVDVEVDDDEEEEEEEEETGQSSSAASSIRNKSPALNTDEDSCKMMAQEPVETEHKKSSNVLCDETVKLEVKCDIDNCELNSNQNSLPVAMVTTGDVDNNVMKSEAGDKGIVTVNQEQSDSSSTQVDQNRSKDKTDSGSSDENAHDIKGDRSKEQTLEIESSLKIKDDKMKEEPMLYSCDSQQAARSSSVIGQSVSGELSMEGSESLRQTDSTISANTTITTKPSGAKDRGSVSNCSSSKELFKYLTDASALGAHSKANIKTGLTKDSSLCDGANRDYKSAQKNINPYSIFEKPDTGNKKSAFVSETLDEYLQANSTLKTSIKPGVVTQSPLPDCLLFPSSNSQESETGVSPMGLPKTAVAQARRNKVSEADFDDIDGIIFMSFSSKEQLVDHLKVESVTRRQGYSGADVINHLQLLKEKSKVLQNRLSRKRSQLRKGYHPVRRRIPVKTDDVTKIKGWKKKFSIEDQVVKIAPKRKKLHWKTQEKLTKSLTPGEIRNMGLNIKKKRRKNLLYTHRKNSRQLESLLTRECAASSDVTAHVSRPYKSKAKRYMYGYRALKAVNSSRRTLRRLDKSSNSLACPVMTQSMALAAMEALQIKKKASTPSNPDVAIETSSPSKCDKPGCRYGCVCHLCESVHESAYPDYESSSERSSTKCDKEYCRLGCICDSLEGTGPKTKEKRAHCGRADCIFGCICKAMLRSAQQRAAPAIDQELEPPVLSKHENIENRKGGKGKKMLSQSPQKDWPLEIAMELSKKETTVQTSAQEIGVNPSVRKSSRLQAKGLTGHKALILLETGGYDLQEELWSDIRNAKKKKLFHEDKTSHHASREKPTGKLVTSIDKTKQDGKTVHMVDKSRREGKPAHIRHGCVLSKKQEQRELDKVEVRTGEAVLTRLMTSYSYTHSKRKDKHDKRGGELEHESCARMFAYCQPKRVRKDHHNKDTVQLSKTSAAPVLVVPQPESTDSSVEVAIFDAADTEARHEGLRIAAAPKNNAAANSGINAAANSVINAAANSGLTLHLTLGVNTSSCAPIVPCTSGAIYMNSTSSQANTVTALPQGTPIVLPQLSLSTFPAGASTVVPSGVSVGSAINSSVSTSATSATSAVTANKPRFTKQMVLLQRKEKKKDTLDETAEDENSTKQGASDKELPHLLEISSHCNWEHIRVSLLNAVSEEVDGKLYPDTKCFQFGDLKAEILPRSHKPTAIPFHLQKTLPSRMFSIRIRITECQEERNILNLPDVSAPGTGDTQQAKSAAVVVLPDVAAKSRANAQAAAALALPRRIEPKLSSHDITNNTSANIVLGSFQGISGLSRLNLTMPGLGNAHTGSLFPCMNSGDPNASLQGKQNIQTDKSQVLAINNSAPHVTTVCRIQGANVDAGISLNSYSVNTQGGAGKNTAEPQPQSACLGNLVANIPQQTYLLSGGVLASQPETNNTQVKRRKRKRKDDLQGINNSAEESVFNEKKKRKRRSKVIKDLLNPALTNLAPLPAVPVTLIGEPAVPFGVYQNWISQQNKTHTVTSTQKQPVIIAPKPPGSVATSDCNLTLTVAPSKSLLLPGSGTENGVSLSAQQVASPAVPMVTASGSASTATPVPVSLYASVRGVSTAMTSAMTSLTSAPIRQTGPSILPSNSVSHTKTSGSEIRIPLSQLSVLNSRPVIGHVISNGIRVPVQLQPMQTTNSTAKSVNSESQSLANSTNPFLNGHVIQCANAPSAQSNSDKRSISPVIPVPIKLDSTPEVIPLSGNIILQRMNTTTTLVGSMAPLTSISTTSTTAMGVVTSVASSVVTSVASISTITPAGMVVSAAPVTTVVTASTTPVISPATIAVSQIGCAAVQLSASTAIISQTSAPDTHLSGHLSADGTKSSACTEQLFTSLSADSLDSHTSAQKTGSNIDCVFSLDPLVTVSKEKTQLNDIVSESDSSACNVKESADRGITETETDGSKNEIEETSGTPSITQFSKTPADGNTVSFAKVEEKWTEHEQTLQTKVVSTNEDQTASVRETLQLLVDTVSANGKTVSVPEAVKCLPTENASMEEVSLAQCTATNVQLSGSSEPGIFSSTDRTGLVSNSVSISAVSEVIHRDDAQDKPETDKPSSTSSENCTERVDSGQTRVIYSNITEDIGNRSTEFRKLDEEKQEQYTVRDNSSVISLADETIIVKLADDYTPGRCVVVPDLNAAKSVVSHCTADNKADFRSDVASCKSEQNDSQSLVGEHGSCVVDIESAALSKPLIACDQNQNHNIESSQNETNSSHGQTVTTRSESDMQVRDVKIQESVCLPSTAERPLVANIENGKLTSHSVEQAAASKQTNTMPGTIQLTFDFTGRAAEKTGANPGPLQSQPLIAVGNNILSPSSVVNGSLSLVSGSDDTSLSIPKPTSPQLKLRPYLQPMLHSHQENARVFAPTSVNTSTSGSFCTSDSDSEIDVEGYDSDEVDIEAFDEMAGTSADQLANVMGLSTIDMIVAKYKDMPSRIYLREERAKGKIDEIQKVGEVSEQPHIVHRHRERLRRSMIVKGFEELRKAMNMEDDGRVPLSKQIILDEALQVIDVLKTRSQELLNERKLLQVQQMYLKTKLQKLKVERNAQPMEKWQRVQTSGNDTDNSSTGVCEAEIVENSGNHSNSVDDCDVRISSVFSLAPIMRLDPSGNEVTQNENSAIFEPSTSSSVHGAQNAAVKKRGTRRGVRTSAASGLPQKVNPPVAVVAPLNGGASSTVKETIDLLSSDSEDDSTHSKLIKDKDSKETSQDDDDVVIVSDTKFKPAYHQVDKIKRADDGEDLDVVIVEEDEPTKQVKRKFDGLSVSQVTNKSGELTRSSGMYDQEDYGDVVVLSDSESQSLSKFSCESSSDGVSSAKTKLHAASEEDSSTETREDGNLIHIRFGKESVTLRRMESDDED